MTANLDIIRAFLELPAGALPAAMWLADDESGSAWAALREYSESEGDSAIREEIRLHADRDGWRDGVIVHV